MYALVKNGDIERINISLPYSIENTDIGLNEPNPERFGLFPIIGSEPTYNPETEVLTGPKYEFDGQAVQRIYSVAGRPPAPIPQVVSMRQARLALLDAGLLDDIDLAIRSMPRQAQIEWEFASEVRRDSGLIDAVKTLTTLSDSDVDNLFLSAATL